MEDLSKYITRFSERAKREPLTNQNKLNEYLISLLSKMVHERSNGAKTLSITPELNVIYSEVFRYLNNDYSLEDEKKHCTVQKWNLDKGLFMIGKCGKGKSMLLDLIAENRRDLKIKGFKFTAYEVSMMYNENRDLFNKIVNGEQCLFLDDVGDEPKEVLSYGNSENVVYRTMKLFFDKVEFSNEKERLFATSNLGQDEINDRYDDRIWSRMVKNCNIIIFGNEIKDFRKL